MIDPTRKYDPSLCWSLNIGTHNFRWPIYDPIGSCCNNWKHNQAPGFDRSITMVTMIIRWWCTKKFDASIANLTWMTALDIEKLLSPSRGTHCLTTVTNHNWGNQIAHCLPLRTRKPLHTSQDSSITPTEGTSSKRWRCSMEPKTQQFSMALSRAHFVHA